MNGTLDEIIQNFDPSRPAEIVNAEFCFENMAFIISGILGNGADKVVYALSDPEKHSVTHVLKIFREQNSLENFQAWQELERKAKAALLEINETDPLRIGDEVIKFAFPLSYYSYINGWCIEIQEYSEGRYLDEEINEAKSSDLYRAISSGDITSILREADNILEKEPVNPKVLQIKGHYLLELGKTTEAIEYLEEALELDPNLDGIHGELANARFRKGDMSTAKMHAREAIQKNPEYREPFDTLFNIEIKTGNIQNAVGIISFLKEVNAPPEILARMEEQVKSCIKERQEIGSGLENVFTGSDNQNYEKISFVLAKLREKFPTHAFVWFVSGTTAMSNNDPRSALNYFAEAYRLDSFDPNVAFHLGFAYLAVSSEDGTIRFLGEWVDTINRLLSSIQEKIKEPRAEGISVLPEEGLFLQSIESVIQNCRTLIELQHESQEGQMQLPIRIGKLLDRVAELFSLLQDFQKILSVDRNESQGLRN